MDIINLLFSILKIKAHHNSIYSLKKITLYLQASIILIAASFTFPVQAENDLTTHLIDIKLNTVTFDEAVIDVAFYYADTSDSISLHVYQKDVSTFSFGYPVKSGINNLQIVIPRDKQRNKSVSTSAVSVYLASKFGETVWKQDVDTGLNISWPGPEYIQELIAGEDIDYQDFSSVQLISIDKLIDSNAELYRSLLLKGIPIHKLRKIGMYNGPSHGFNHAKITIGSEVDVKLSKLIISLAINSQNIEHISEISIGDNEISRFSQNEIFISAGNMRKSIDKQTIDKLISPSTTTQEFLSLLGYEQPDNDTLINTKYELAYKLIDSGNRENLYRAKSILDEIIAINPNYPRAYIELARFQMKTSDDFQNEGLAIAERTLLIAKKIDPELSDTRTLLGYVYSNQGRYEEAQKEFEIAQTHGSDNLWLYANWGRNYEFQNDFNNALEKYLVVFNKKRSFGRNDRAVIWTYDVIFPLLIKAKRFDEADKLYSKYSTEYPKYTCTLMDQASLRIYKMNDYNGAIESHMKATQKGCSHHYPYLAISYYAQWQHSLNENLSDEATSAYNRAEALGLSDATLFRELARSDYLSPIISMLNADIHNIDAEDKDGLTPLFYWILRNDMDATKRLLSNGANVNYASRKLQITPMMLAIMKQNEDMIKLILQYKPDLTRQLPTGQSLSDWLNTNGFETFSTNIPLEQKI